MASKAFYHPAQLTSGADFAHGSAAERCRLAAMGVLAASFHLHTGGRQAECFRIRWQDATVVLTEELTGVPGIAEVPLWTLGLASVLQQFQLGLGTGGFVRFYDCKHG
jgi:hypothetical protein